MSEQTCTVKKAVQRQICLQMLGIVKRIVKSAVITNLQNYPNSCVSKPNHETERVRLDIIHGDDDIFARNPSAS